MVDKIWPRIGGQGGRLVKFDVNWIQKILNSATERRKNNLSSQKKFTIFINFKFSKKLRNSVIF